MILPSVSKAASIADKEKIEIREWEYIIDNGYCLGYQNWFERSTQVIISRVKVY